MDGMRAVIASILGAAVGFAFAVACWHMYPPPLLPAIDDGRRHHQSKALEISPRRLLPNGSGQGACKGIQVDLQPCDAGQCGNMPPPGSCAWSDWSEWSRCTCGGIQRRQRAIATPGGLGGAPCNGPREEAQPCRAMACKGNHAVDCQLSAWSPWSVCTHSCQGGQQYHSREVIVRQADGGAFCSGSLHETRVCSIQACPGMKVVDCRWGKWSVWSTCTVSCGNGEKARSRQVVVAPKNGGRLCDPVTSAESARCGSPCGGTTLDCLWTTWTSWSTCSKSCGRGQKFRSRHVARQAKAGGAGCHGYLEDFQSCQHSCSTGGQDCQFGTWSAWSDCTAPCNGQQSRTRVLATASVQGGLPCRGPTEEVKPCHKNAAMCKSQLVDCRLAAWESWSTCSRSCGGGMSERKRTIAVHAQGNGKPCSGDMEAVRPCSTNECPGITHIDCKWSRWSSWSACTSTCGGGEQRRHRSIISEATVGGKACDAGSSLEVNRCGLVPCTEHKYVCEWSPWAAWSTCQRAGVSVTCGGGQRKRSRATHFVLKVVKLQVGRRMQAAASHDKDINKMSAKCNEVQDVLGACAQNECGDPDPVDCVWGLWSEWSACPCNGVTERHRVIADAAIGTGKPCEGSEVQAQHCHASCNEGVALDCEYSTWSGWSACAVSCGGGVSTKFRTVVQYPRFGGKACIQGLGGVRQQRKCNQIPCPIKQDCRWGDWTPYSACSLTCGGGQMSRARQVVQTGNNAGHPCEKKSTSMVTACNTQPCPSSARDCEFSNWNDWHICSQTCGIGTQFRGRVVMIEATEDGKPCRGKLQSFKECNLGRCQAKPRIHCRWAYWGTWSACSALCNGHRERSRAIERFAKNSGRACAGPERDMRGCNINSPVCKEQGPQDCHLGAWQMWTTCSKRCEGGQHYRTREVQIPARNFGRPCEGPLQQAQACNTATCPGKDIVNCAWGDWEQWSACTVTCSGGQQVRHRGIVVEASRDGTPCAAQASMELMPCNLKPCTGAMEVCGWGPWNPWEDCPTSCGGAQQQRLRLKRWLPSTVAEYRSGTTSNIGTRRLLTSTQRRLFPLGGIDDCTGSQKETRPCGIGPCNGGGPTPVACRWAAWSDWSACSCEGFRERGRRVAERARNGGLVCVGPLRVTKACSPQCDQISADCIFSEWAPWSECSSSCGGGQKYNSRALKTHAVKFGAGCHGQLEQIQPCNTFPCEALVDCKYEDWSPWGSCSRSCDGGQKSRSRDVAHYPTLGGKPCKDGDLLEVAGCGTQSCTPWSAGDCRWSLWSSWSECSATCGFGRQSRSRNVASVATHHGKPCNGLYEQYKNCSLPSCGKPPSDCTFQSWSTWSQCYDFCAGHQARSRNVKSFSTGQGGTPCQGALRQVRPCEGHSSTACGHDSADCKVGEWSPWSACTRSCGGGQYFSHRHIVQQARGSGNPCNSLLKLTAACRTMPCPGTQTTDCVLGQWSPFSACSASCGGGEMRRHRSVEKEARYGGRLCSASDILEVQPCSTEPCNGEGYCTWSAWSLWQDCSTTCGPGEKNRRRHQSFTPQSSHQALPPPSNLAATYSNRVALHPEDPITKFALRHDFAICSLAITGAVAMVLGFGQLLCAAHRSAPQVTVHDFEETTRLQ